LLSGAIHDNFKALELYRLFRENRENRSGTREGGAAGMKDTLAQLAAWGCDTKGALARVLDDRELLLSCIGQVAEDPAFEVLGKSLQSERIREAFDAAHTLKGIIANTGLTPLYAPVVAIVEPLRTGETAGTADAYRQLLEKRAELRNILKTDG
jgi:hypothetical protein